MDSIKEEIEQLETELKEPGFWQNKAGAQAKVRRLNELKEELKGVGKYDKGDAVLTLFAGAGGDDAEDWVRILFDMYSRYIGKQNWDLRIVHEHKAQASGGFKNITFEVTGSGAYGKLKMEQGVHRLVRISPYSSKKLRHTSFALLEVIPKFVKPDELKIPDGDLKIEFARSSGAGGQNVNKRETSVRIVHLPTKIAVHCENERSQLQNKERALELLRAKLYKLVEDNQNKKERAMKISKEVQPEWGNQIRSYIFHPYQLVKDHRTNVEERDVDKVLDGDLDKFINTEK